MEKKIMLNKINTIIKSAKNDNVTDVTKTVNLLFSLASKKKTIVKKPVTESVIIGNLNTPKNGYGIPRTWRKQLVTKIGKTFHCSTVIIKGLTKVTGSEKNVDAVISCYNVINSQLDIMSHKLVPAKQEVNGGVRIRKMQPFCKSVVESIK